MILYYKTIKERGKKGKPINKSVTNTCLRFEDAGMEFRDTETDGTLPPNQGTQNADIGDTLYSKARNVWMNLFKATLPVSAPAATQTPASTPDSAVAPLTAPTRAPTPASIDEPPVSPPAPALTPTSTAETAPGQAPTSAVAHALASAIAPTSSFPKRTLGFLMFLVNWIVYPFKVLRYGRRWICAIGDTFILLHLKKCEPDINSLLEDEVAHNKALLVVRTICNRLRLQSTIQEKRLHYQSAASVAACKDQHEALKEITEHFPEVMLMEGDGYNLMQLAVKYRSEKVFNFLAYQTKVDTYFFKAKPKYGTSLLHYAGGLTPTEKLDQDSGAALQMRKEVKWYKKVEAFSLPGCNNEKNNMDETPMMVFRREHADLKKQGEEWMKKVADSYIIVAALIITITFAAIITVPGGSEQGSTDSSGSSPAASPVNNVGLPVFIKNNHFKVFVYADLTSFCCATCALVMFLSILTSRYTEEDFINKLPWKLTIGLFMLIVSLLGMLVAFGETLHLMLGHKDIPLLIVIVASLGIPIVIFIVFQVRMILKIFH